jgi:hypothetical protein
MDWSYSNFPVLSMHRNVEKGKSNFSPNPTLELLFAKKARTNRSKNASSLAHQASNNKIEIIAHPTDHDNAHFEPTQQPTNNPAALQIL